MTAVVRKNVKKFAVLLSCLLFLGGGPAQAAPRPEDWTWNVCVIPPEGGWETERGQSIRATLSWHQAVIAESGDGVKGHDLEFILVPPVNEDTAAEARFPIDSHTAAILSFASDLTNRPLAERFARGPVPLLLAEGEEVFWGEGDGALFALDLFRDYRAVAFAAYAAKVSPPEARLGVIASRFALDQEREAKIALGLLSDAGLMPLPFWVDASVSDSFKFVAQEVQSYSQGVLIACVGNMAAKELWRGIMYSRSPWQLWQCGRPDDSFLSFRGMIFADQNLLLEDLGGFEALKRDLWSTRVVKVTAKEAAGRANALALWLSRGLEGMPGTGERLDLAELRASLAAVSGIPFGAQTLDIDPATRRPAARKVRILEVRNRSFAVRDTLSVEGLKP